MTVFMRFPQGKPKALTLSYDDGKEQDKQLMTILDKNGLKATFNLNSNLYALEDTVYPPGEYHRTLSKQAATALYTHSGHEVAVHSLTHPFLEKLPDSRVLYEILEDRKNLEQQFQTVVRGMAYPWGTYNDQTVEMAQRAGIAYARTTISTGDFRLPADWLRLTTTCHHNDPRLMELARRFVGQSPLQEPYDKDPWLFYLWGHSYEFEALNNWQRIEEFSTLIGGRTDVWYATNIEIYEYIQAYRRLEFSVSGEFVTNPSAVDVYFEFNNRLVQVAVGATAHIDA